MDGWIQARHGAGVMVLSGLVAAALAGCGGSSTTTSQTRSSSASAAAPAPTQTTQTSAKSPVPAARADVLSRSQLTARADAICKQVQAEINAVKPKTVSDAEIVRLVPGRATSERHAAVALGKLTPPTAIAADWQLVVRYRRTLAHELEDLVEAARHHATHAIAMLGTTKQRNHEQLLAAAKRVGVQECGQVG
jgi:hypothetical protein